MQKADESLSPMLTKQIHGFIDDLETYNTKLERPHSKKNYLFIRDFYLRFFEDRNKRATEVESSEYADIVRMANSQFAATTLWDLCMDGRVLAVLVCGASAGVGSSIRVPGGILREFVRGKDGKYKLIPTSNFARLLERALKRFESKTLYEIFDSHIACAARKAEELAHGRETSDYGLLADVLFKKNMSMATSVFINQKIGNTRRVVTIQTSFDPHSGYMFMGLETKKALAYAYENGGEYTDVVLRRLAKDNCIIFSGDIASHPIIRELFRTYSFDLDWRSEYVKSAKEFWHNIASMKDKAFPTIIKQLRGIYPNLQPDNKDSNEELQERAILLLANAYSGFLNNQQHTWNVVGKSAGKEQGDEFYNYPYGIHKEEGVKVSEGGYPPYDISMFVVFSLDKKNLSANIELASTLVRGNRRDKRVVDRSGNFTDPSEFAEGPVPVVIQEIIRERLSQDEWDTLSQIDWDDMPSMWNTMSESNFFDYLQTKGSMSVAVANGINRLRERMAILYDPDNPTSAHLIEQYKVAMPVVVGKNRRNYFIVPFVKLGFE
ncbi:MAG: hypothetical protein HY430_00230 [Candidatus Levybacteria bacterium]|nr:hypothetical protein [Candidatus Levybacteria bacterium]